MAAQNNAIDALNSEIGELYTAINDPDICLKVLIKQIEESLAVTIKFQKTQTKERQEANLLCQ